MLSICASSAKTMPWLTGTTRFDDLIPEESDAVQSAIKRLPPKEAYDRVFRIRRAFQVRSTAMAC